MKRFNSIPPLFISLFLLVFLSCTQSDEQREFEREAISLPENITVTSANGDIVEGQTDPDDWRIAPFFQGMIYVEPPPPFPNPLLTNQRLNIQIHVPGIDAVSGLRVIALYNESSTRLLYSYPSSPLPTGLTSVSLDALDIARFRESPVGLYRLILEDFEGNIISYGDVRIE